MAKKNRDKETNSRRRRGPGTRPISEPILLFVQGECTEKDYFKLLKRCLRLQSLTIITESQSPENLIKQTKTTISRENDAPFSAIYYVVDVDETSDEQFRQAFKAAKKATDRKNRIPLCGSLFSHWENLSTLTSGKSERKCYLA